MVSDSAQQLFVRGNALFGASDLRGAADCYRQALEIEPEFASASFNLGCTMSGLAGPAQALPHFIKAAALRPDWCEARTNLGFTLARVGRMQEAAAELQAAAALRPNDAAIRNDLGLALSALGRGEEAFASFREAIRLNPQNPEAHNNLAVLFERFGRSSEAISACLEALQLRPGYPEAHNNLACALKSQGRHGEAIAHYREALRLKPDYTDAVSSLLFTLCYPADIPEEEVAAEHLAFGRACRIPAQPHENDPSPERELRIGYVSADFRSHAVARFIEPVLRHHDRSRFRIFCYSNVSVPDDASARIAGLCDRFVNIAGVPDAAAEELIRRDRIDILVDLSGHTADHRLLLFARKPAPIQITWLGYPHTTGLESIDYRITDPVADPLGETDRYYSEKLIRLPGNFSCFSPHPEAPEVGELPCLPSGAVTFGSFNNPAKITPETVALWAGALHRVPGSRLLVKGYSLADAGARERLAAQFAAQGIAADRLELIGNTPSYLDHLGLYRRVDIALDTFPYNGTTTTCEALWMGVPVVTLAGTTHRSRVGATLLAALADYKPRSAPGFPLPSREGVRGRGEVPHPAFVASSPTPLPPPVKGGGAAGRLSEEDAGFDLCGLVARSPEEFSEIAAALAFDRPRLERLRRTLRPTMAASRLTDAARFTGDLEAALREVWRGWCRERGLGKQPHPHPCPPLEGEGDNKTVSLVCSQGHYASLPLQGGGQEEDGLPLAARLLEAGDLDQALQHFLAALRSADQSALGGIEQTLNWQMAEDLAEALDRDSATAGTAPSTRNVQRIAAATLEQTADLLLAHGMVTPAELVCRYLLDRRHRSHAVSRTLGDVALRLGAAACAAGHFRDAGAAGDGSVATKIKLNKAQEYARVTQQPRQGERYLLIKAWGFGFWSDVNHLLGQLLLAEMTGRIPVVHWGGNSLFSDDAAGNAFESFFAPISAVTLDHLAAPGKSYYPPKWNAANLAQNEINKFAGAWSRTSSLHILERSEDVVVSDFHYAVNDLAPWIPPGHHLHGMSTDALYLYLSRRYLRVKRAIEAKADAFFRENLEKGSTLALHVRGGDKGGEDANLARLNSLYRPEIERFLQREPTGRLYLMTDDQEILADYLRRYGARVVHTGATRTGTGEGVHYQKHASRYRLGEEVLVDTLIALRCDAFVGNGLSNVSCAAAQMREWAPGTLKLFGARLDRLRQLTLYRS